MSKFPVSPSLVVICDWPADPADITPALARRLCETGDVKGAITDMVRECLALAAASASAEPKDAA